MSDRFMIILVAIVAIFAGIIFFSKQDSKAPEQSGDSSQSVASEHIYGNAESSVKLVEFGDFQCPACASYHPLIKQVKEKYKDQISFQFRHFPLTEIHQNALISSRAAEAAGQQGKFWEMHDLLYENQDSWAQSSNPSPIFDQYAENLELDLPKFQEYMRSTESNATIQADRAEAKRLNYTSTPTFSLNGEKLENPPTTVEDFSKLIDEALAKQEQ